MSEEAERNPEFAGLLPKRKDWPLQCSGRTKSFVLRILFLCPANIFVIRCSGWWPDEKIRWVISLWSAAYPSPGACFMAREPRFEGSICRRIDSTQRYWLFSCDMLLINLVRGLTLRS